MKSAHTSSRKRTSSLWRKFFQAGNRWGTYSVEFAITIPIVFTIALGGMEFSHFCFMRHSMNQASYEAARIMIVPGANAADAQARANVILDASGLQVSKMTITPQQITNSTREVQVQIEGEINTNWPTAVFFKDLTFTAVTTLDHENQSLYVN